MSNFLGISWRNYQVISDRWHIGHEFISLPYQLIETIVVATVILRECKVTESKVKDSNFFTTVVPV